MGLRTATDIERYEADVQKRVRSCSFSFRNPANLRLNRRYRLKRRLSSPQTTSSAYSCGWEAIGDQLVQTLGDKAAWRHFRSLKVREKLRRLFARVRRALVRLRPSSEDNVRSLPFIYTWHTFLISYFYPSAAAPLNLANSPSLHLLTPAEQMLCSTLRIMPKPYLAMKETLVREYARRGGQLRRREARELLKIDVNKTSRVWDFLHQAGFLKASLDDRDREPPNNA